MSKLDFDFFMEALLPLLDRKEHHVLRRNATKLSETAKDLHSILNRYETILLKKEEKVEYLKISILYTIGWISIYEVNTSHLTENIIYKKTTPAKLITLLRNTEESVYLHLDNYYYQIVAKQKKLQSLYNNKQELKLKQMNPMHDMLNL